MPTPSPSVTPKEAGAGEKLVLDRPYRELAPKRPLAAPAPLVLLLHGYMGNGESLAEFLQFDAVVAQHDVYLAMPDGTPDDRGYRFWNATDACCNFHGSTVDDVGYLGAVIDDMMRKHAIDPKRVYVVGFSNGGFMAHRLACDLAPRVAGIATLGAMGFKDEARCRPSEPVAVLQANADRDQVIGYDGGVPGGNLPLAAAFPSARASIEAWARRDGCTSRAPLPSIRLVSDFDETSVERWSGCRNGAGVELWTIHGAPHIPHLRPGWSERVFTFLDAHPKG